MTNQSPETSGVIEWQRIETLHSLIVQMDAEDPNLFGDDTIDITGLSRAEIRRVMRRESYKIWSKREKFQAAFFITVGIATIGFAGLGIIPLAIGFWLRHNAYKRHVAAIRARTS